MHCDLVGLFEQRTHYTWKIMFEPKKKVQWKSAVENTVIFQKQFHLITLQNVEYKFFFVKCCNSSSVDIYTFNGGKNLCCFQWIVWEFFHLLPLVGQIAFANLQFHGQKEEELRWIFRWWIKQTLGMKHELQNGTCNWIFVWSHPVRGTVGKIAGVHSNCATCTCTFSEQTNRMS